MTLYKENPMTKNDSNFFMKKAALDDAFMHHQITDEFYLRSLAELESHKTSTDPITHINSMRKKRLEKWN